MSRLNSPTLYVQVKSPRRTGRFRRAARVIIKPRDPLLDSIMDDIDAMLEAEKPKPPRESALLIIRDEDPVEAKPSDLPPNYGCVARMSEIDRWPRPIRDVFNEYFGDNAELIDYKKLRKALDSHPAEVVAKALASKLEAARKARQFESLNPVELP